MLNYLLVLFVNYYNTVVLEYICCTTNTLHKFHNRTSWGIIKGINICCRHCYILIKQIINFFFTKINH